MILDRTKRQTVRDFPRGVMVQAKREMKYWGSDCEHVAVVEVKTVLAETVF